jgi:hypothetical protein
MIHLKNGTEVLDNLRPVASRGTGVEHWGSSYFGPRYSTDELSPGPQSLMTQMCAGETILPHFHGVSQFQLFPDGSGTVAKTELRPLMLQYKDHHTGYGPLVAGPHGLTFISLRNRTGNSHPVYIGRPGYREALRPGKRRNWVTPTIPLSTRPVLQYRTDVSWEPLYDAARIDDELAAFILRMGTGLSTPGLDPEAGGGCYLFVANGSLELCGQSLPRWSMVYADPGEAAYTITAGPLGAEVVVMQFPKDG